MPNRQIVNGEPYRYNYQGQELDPETGKVAFQLRLYDPRINRWLTTDPKGQYHSPYMAMGNNWMNGVDQDGAEYNPVYGSDGAFRGYDKNGVGGDGIVFDGDFEGGMDLSGFLDNGGAKFVADLNNIEMFRFAGKGLGHLNRENFLNQLDQSTLRQNIFGLTYPGGNNPTRFNGKADYSSTPDDLSEYPAIGHDRRYDVLGVAGASGLFTDARAIGADYKFVSEELRIVATPYLPLITRIRAGALGVGLGISALPKTIYKLNTAPTIGVGVIQIMTDYHISNIGVTNKPGN